MKFIVKGAAVLAGLFIATVFVTETAMELASNRDDVRNGRTPKGAWR